MNLNVMLLTVAVVAFTVVTYRLINRLMADSVSRYVENVVMNPEPLKSWHCVAYALLRDHQDNGNCRGAGCYACQTYNDYYTVHLYGDPDA